MIWSGEVENLMIMKLKDTFVFIVHAIANYLIVILHAYRAPFLSLFITVCSSLLPSMI